MRDGSKFSYKTEISFPEICTDPLGELEIFLRVNGYAIEVNESGLVALRGEKGKGFWTSDLTVLPTELTIEMKGKEKLRVNYEVNCSGQILNKEEKNFWKREAEAIQTYLKGGKIENFLEKEKENASEIRLQIIKRGLYFSAIISFLLFFLFLFLSR